MAKTIPNDRGWAESDLARYLCVDYGTKRIGLAVGDDQTRVATPLETLSGTGRARKDAQVVLARGRDFEVDAYVVGLPVHMDGVEGGQAKMTRKFGEQLAQVGGAPVHFWDERLSSRGADEVLEGHSGSPGKKRSRRDALAAQIILQEFLDAEAQEQDAAEVDPLQGDGCEQDSG
jgi:putative Holliday junction resolvase